MSRKFTVESQIVGVRSLGDGGLSLNIHTKELPTVEKAVVMDFHNKAGWLLFKEDEVQEEDIPKQNSDFEGKSPSQRQRAVLFLLWRQNGSQGDFETYYREQMEKVINAIKNKLE